MLTRLRAERDVSGSAGTWKEAAVRHGLLPVYADWECAYALTPAGEPVYTAVDRWAAPDPLTNPRHRFVVFAQAADRYPELSHLRPTRGPDDPTCRSCGGTGYVWPPNAVPGDPRILCECGGLGWYPAGTELGPT